MKAKAGRASYVSADVLKNHDPRATVVAIWLRAAFDTLSKLNHNKLIHHWFIYSAVPL